MRFERFAPLFARCWDTQNTSLLEPLVDERGFWVIYNVGIWEDAYSFERLTNALGSPGAGRGFGYLEVTRFDCAPKLGTDPGPKNCTGEERTNACQFGTARVDLVGFLDRRAADASRRDERKEPARLRVRALAAQARITHFMTDQAWGAVFYFGSTDGQWTLIAVSTADCSI